MCPCFLALASRSPLAWSCALSGERWALSMWMWFGPPSPLVFSWKWSKFLETTHHVLTSVNGDRKKKDSIIISRRVQQTDLRLFRRELGLQFITLSRSFWFYIFPTQKRTGRSVWPLMMDSKAFGTCCHLCFWNTLVEEVSHLRLPEVLLPRAPRDKDKRKLMAGTSAEKCPTAVLDGEEPRNSY